MYDSTENIRRDMVADINSAPGSRVSLESEYGEVMDTTEVQSKYEITGFMAPFVVVVRRSDGVKGSLMFQDQPRFYFRFKESS